MREKMERMKRKEMLKWGDDDMNRGHLASETDPIEHENNRVQVTNHSVLKEGLRLCSNLEQVSSITVL